MRFGVISDVHGNLHALRAVVSDLRQQGVDGWLSLGDMIGYGPHPNECVEIIADLDAVGIAGNHELIALGEIEGAGSSRGAWRSHAWTAAALNADVVAALAQLPRRMQVDGGIVLSHGSLDDPEEYVYTVTAAERQLARLADEYPAAKLLLLGNTHHRLLCAQRLGCLPTTSPSPVRLDVSQRYLANPGSVGQSREWGWPPPAHAMLLDVGQLSVQFREVPYDINAARRELARHGLRYEAIQAPPRLRWAAKRRVRDLLGAVGIHR